MRENNPYANRTWVWTYDGAGNIRSRTEHPYTTDEPSVVLDTVLYDYPGEDSGWGDLLLSYGDRVFVYDSCGNLTEDNDANGRNNRTYEWSQGRQLSAATVDDHRWTYTYDANGMCTRRMLHDYVGYIYEYNGTQLSALKFLYYDLRFTYDAAGRPLTLTFHHGENCGNDFNVACRSDCGTYYYVTNLQGDVVAILDETGTVVVEYTYDAWGKLLTTEGTLKDTLGYINPLRYRGYVYDHVTGFYYLQSRYYDPEIGRFISADSVMSDVGGDMLGSNLFAYCLNNPVNRTDPNGNWSMPNWLKITIGVAATVAAVVVAVGTGGAAAPVLIGVAASAIGGAAFGAISHRVTTGSWEGADKAAWDGAVDGLMTGGLCALGGAIVGGAVRTIKNAKSGITIGKLGTFEDIAKLGQTRRYSGLKEYDAISRIVGEKTAEKVAWWQNKCVVKGVMALKGAIYDCGGPVTGFYAREIALTKGYQFLYNVWLM